MCWVGGLSCGFAAESARVFMAVRKGLSTRLWVRYPHYVATQVDPRFSQALARYRLGLC